MSTEPERYDPWRSGPEVICRECGAAVKSQSAHDRFHASLAAVVAAPGSPEERHDG